MTTVTVTLTEPAPARLTDTVHVYCPHCCTPDTALCGHDISDGHQALDPTDRDCVVCLDLEEQHGADGGEV